MHKFPLLTVSYVNATGAYNANSALVKVNSGVVGINDLNFDAAFNVFPNPAKNNFIVKLSNQLHVNCTIEIINSIGQTARKVDLGNNTEISENVSISDLVPGVYIVKTILGDKISSRKLVIE